MVSETRASNLFQSAVNQLYNIMAHMGIYMFVIGWYCSTPVSVVSLGTKILLLLSSVNH
jgi:hypothetical protein